MRNKRKGILMASAILGSAAIVSTGFAAWVITSNTTATATGNIQVDMVQDNRLTVQQSWKNGDTVIFGAPKTMDAENPWLLNKDGVEECLSLTLVIDLKFTNPGTRANENDIDGVITVTGFECNEATLNSQYVRMPALEDTTYTVTDGGAVEIPINFQWGTKFGETSTNPYNYYNDGTKTGDSHGTDAFDTLTEIYKYNGYTFTLSLEFTWANS